MWSYDVIGYMIRMHFSLQLDADSREEGAQARECCEPRPLPVQTLLCNALNDVRDLAESGRGACCVTMTRTWVWIPNIYIRVRYGNNLSVL